MPRTAPTGYSLGADDAERRRLIAQCERNRPEAERLFDRIGVQPGWRALDLGCGPLGVLIAAVRQTGGVAGAADGDPGQARLTVVTHTRRNIGCCCASSRSTGTGSSPPAS